MSSIIGIYRKSTGDIMPPTKIQVDHEGFQSKNPDHQVSFITLEGENHLRAGIIKGFCHSKFKADFVLEGISHNEVKPSDKVAIGSAIFEITEVGKDCHDTCTAITPKGTCGVNRFVFFGKIIKEGQVKVDDKLKFL